jgi:alkanesulfonate monooxygenase SsuD/methylene tetrahydromethanopterin reductase-like flavin-dependent oxidoreductase (luciferase family)
MPNQILFGADIDPASDDPQETFARAKTADQHHLDLITIQDHPYNRNFFETWTLMTALATATERIHIGSNVLSTPLRPPAMLAKMAATLDVLSGGRLELGLGAGAYPPGIAAYGGEKLSPGEQFQAFKESVEIIKGMWSHSNSSFSYQGEHHRIKGARPGPAPAHDIRLWFGAIGPRMLNLTGQMADGLLISTTYVPEKKLPEYNERIDEGADEAGRNPDEIRRGYNLMGVLDLGRPDTKLDDPEKGVLVGSVARWVEKIVQLNKEYRQDTFIFWAVAGNRRLQIEAFAREVVPAVRAELEPGP